MPDVHSKIVGGSSAARVIACSASIDECAKAPSSPSSPYAEEGTALHSCMEYLLDPTVRRKRTADDALGLMFNKHVMTEELINEAVRPGLAYFEKVIGRHKLKYELEVTAEFPGIPGAFGTTDVSALSKNGETLIIFDWKFGKGVPVTAKMNMQLMFYACCVIEKLKLWRKVKRIDMHICQPRVRTDAPDDDGDDLGGNSRCVIDMRQLRAFKHQLIRAVNGVRTYGTGPHCRWCDGTVTCPAKREEAEYALKMKAMGPDIAEAMKLVPLLEDWVRAVKESCHTALEQGAVVDGFKLVEKRAMRKWAVDDPQVRAYLASHGLTEDQFAPRSLVSAPQAEKLLKPKGEKLKSDMIKAESTGYTVAPESDKRPAVSAGRDLNALASLINPKEA